MEEIKLLGVSDMLFSNEVVFRGHPDKVCDQISDALVDAYLEGDEFSRCGIEVMGGKGKIFITGEVTSEHEVDVEKVVKRVLRDVGYSTNYEILNNLGMQSSDIALGTNENVLGAGDNGLMFGYANHESNQFLPTAVLMLQEFAQWYDHMRKIDSRFLPDGKSQITGKYVSGNLVGVQRWVVCYQNTENVRSETDKMIIDKIHRMCKKYDVRKPSKILINPTGRFNIGGFDGDAGLTGRKIVVDSYQGFSRVGGGAFSGKDPTKVDRSGAYKARQIAIDVLDEHFLEWCEVQISYSIGIEEPMSIYINSDKGRIPTPKHLYEECKLRNIIKDLNLRKIKYEDLAAFGHFGRGGEYAWG